MEVEIVQCVAIAKCCSLPSCRQFIQVTEYNYIMEISRCVKGKWGVVTVVVGVVGMGVGGGGGGGGGGVGWLVWLKHK